MATVDSRAIVVSSLSLIFTQYICRPFGFPHDVSVCCSPRRLVLHTAIHCLWPGLQQLSPNSFLLSLSSCQLAQGAIRSQISPAWNPSHCIYDRPTFHQSLHIPVGLQSHAIPAPSRFSIFPTTWTLFSASKATFTFVLAALCTWKNSSLDSSHGWLLFFLHFILNVTSYLT